MEAPINIEADASIAKPIGDFQRKELVESPMPAFYKKHSMPTSIKKGSKVGFVLKKNGAKIYS